MWRFDTRVQAVWCAVETYLRELPEPLPSQWQEDEHGMTTRCGVDRIRELTGNREMFPSAPMIWWTAEAVGYEDQEKVHRLCEGALLAYLYFRLQDDVVDGHAASPGGLLTGNLCLDRFHALYRSIFAPDHPLWKLWNEVLATYSATTLWELRGRRHRRRDFSTADISRLGDKFIPVLAPCAGVAYLAHREDVILDLRELVLHLGSGLQLLNDHKGIAHDFRTRNYTSVISDILRGVPQVRELESASFPRNALTSAAMERNLQRSTRCFALARQSAIRLRMVHALDYIEENTSYLDAEIHRLSGLRAKAKDLERRDAAALGEQP